MFCASSGGETTKNPVVLVSPLRAITLSVTLVYDSKQMPDVSAFWSIARVMAKLYSSSA